MADRERLDVERAAPEQRRDAVQDARLVVDVDRKSVQHLRSRSGQTGHCCVQSAAVSTIGDGRRIILCRSAPAGTIGYTESSCSTLKSMSAARPQRRAASTAPATWPRLVTAVADRPNASASFTQSGFVSGVAA